MHLRFFGFSSVKFQLRVLLRNMRVPEGTFVSQALILGIFTNLVLLSRSNDAGEG